MRSSRLAQEWSRSGVDIFRVVPQTIVKKKLFYAVPNAETYFKDCTFWHVSHVKMRLLTSQRTRRLLNHTTYALFVEHKHSTCAVKRAPAVL